MTDMPDATTPTLILKDGVAHCSKCDGTEFGLWSWSLAHGIDTVGINQEHAISFAEEKSPYLICLECPESTSDAK